jgi:replicative DNA helicase
MSAEQLSFRMLSSIGRIEQNRLRTGKLLDDDWPRVDSAVSMMSEAPIYIDDSGALTPTEVRARARRLKREHGLGLIVVDYLQLMQVTGTAENRATEISEISRSLKALAKELSVPVVALSQLNRQVENRHPPIPRLADLRECVTGDTLVVLADGRRVPIVELVGATPRVVAVSGDRLVTAVSDKVWLVGRRPVFRVVLAGGRSIRATGRHRLLSGTRWRRVDELHPGSPVTVARTGSTSVSATPHVTPALMMLGGGDGSLSIDRVVAIEPAGEADVYDLTVPGPASWLADGIVSHNSGAIEQDADVIMFLYRDEYYHEDSDKKGIAEVIVSKQRNGPIGNVELTFLKEFTRFENREVSPDDVADGGHPGGVPGPL